MDKVTMSVQEMAMQMGISLSKAYALTREDGFPIVRVGKRVLIPVSEFKISFSNLLNFEPSVKLSLTF